MNLTQILIKLASVFLLIGLIAYLFPSLNKISDLNLKLFLNNNEGTLAFKRSIIFGLCSTFLNIIFSLFIAISISNITLNSKKGRLITFLIVPIMLGNVSIAFIGKIMFSDSAFFQQGSLIKFGTLTLIQFWQYGTLYIYLFWLNIQNIPKTSLNYAFATKMTFGERVKDLILPSCRNLSILLVILNFILSVYEDAKIQIIFKSSVGTHSEMISQWLNRTYQTNSLINAIFANERTIQYSTTILFVALILTIIFTLVFSRVFNRFIRLNTALKIPTANFLHKSLPYFLLAFVFLPLIYTIYSTLKNFRFDFYHLLIPFLFTFVTTLLALIFSIILGITLRLGWKQALSSFNNRSLFFFVLLFILQLVPPIIIYITGFQWLKVIGYQDVTYLQFIWVIGHVILILPLIISFVSVFHFRTSNNEINYLESHKFSLPQILIDSFFRRYKAEYLFTFLIGFSLIWNESIINNLLSDFIPSFVSEMKMNIEGRASDYAKGMNYLFVGLGIALVAMWIWQLILNKSFKQKNENA